MRGGGEGGSELGDEGEVEEREGEEGDRGKKENEKGGEREIRAVGRGRVGGGRRGNDQGETLRISRTRGENVGRSACRERVRISVVADAPNNKKSFATAHSSLNSTHRDPLP